MNKIYHDIFKAIHEGKWLKIEYRNKGEEVTKFWIGIRSLDVAKRKLLVDGLHIGMYTIGENYNLSIDNILSTQIIEGSFCPVNEKLVEDIYLNPHKYKTFFDNTANLKILNYLEMCNKMDTTPYYSDFELIRYLDREKFMGESYQLSNEQFQQVVKNFQYGKNEKKHDDGRLSIQQLGMNVLSIHTPKGLYVLAYRKLQMDVKRKVLRPDEDITICTEFVMGESKESIRKFLDADEYELLKDFEKNQEKIKDCVTKHSRQVSMEMLPFQTDLQGRQLRQVQKKIAEAGEFTDADAMALLDTDFEQLKMYLYYTSARYIKKLGDSRYKDLYNIIFNTPEDQQVDSFSKYLGETENVKKLQKIFPMIITTCISAHKLGEPTSMFDMVIMDEASQCNTAVSLVPIIRGDNLMLVGDPQQLSPVILLDDITNQKLRRKYNIADEYDYRKNSIYKTYLACDAVSDEVLLHNHYRCNKKIIGFNNKKYYNSKLKVCSCSAETQPLLYVDVRNGNTMVKNTAPVEVDAIIQYASTNKDKTIGVITPFVNQKKLIEEALKRAKLDNVVCGTVHAFQGDEKDVVLFSTALTDQTRSGTYEWLKNNKELLNVATSRARDKLIVLADSKNLKRLHEQNSEDDLFELVEYVQKNGQSHVTEKRANSRALGVKPFSTATEEAFLANLTHALENIWLSQSRYSIHKEVAISQVFQDNLSYNDLFYSGRFDFVVYEKQGRMDIPVLAIELDGKEHFSDEVVKNRDRKKNQICKEHNLQIIRVENSYARRYNHIKEILLSYFSIRR